jgi:hypothetical protein
MKGGREPTRYLVVEKVFDCNLKAESKSCFSVHSIFFLIKYIF